MQVLNKVFTSVLRRPAMMQALRREPKFAATKAYLDMIASDAAKAARERSALTVEA